MRARRHDLTESLDSSVPRDGSSFEALTDGLSVRARNVLRRLQIQSVNDLDQLSEQQLRGAWNCGNKTTHEIMKLRQRLAGEGVRVWEEITSEEDLPTELLIEVSSLNLSVRASRCLARAGIERVADLVVYSADDLFGLRNCGRKSVEEIRITLGKLGLGLGMSIPAWSDIDPAEFTERRKRSLSHVRRKLQEEFFGVDSSGSVELREQDDS